MLYECISFSHMLPVNGLRVTRTKVFVLFCSDNITVVNGGNNCKQGLGLFYGHDTLNSLHQTASYMYIFRHGYLPICLYATGVDNFNVCHFVGSTFERSYTGLMLS